MKIATIILLPPPIHQAQQSFSGKLKTEAKSEENRQRGCKLRWEIAPGIKYVRVYTFLRIFSVLPSVAY